LPQQLALQVIIIIIIYLTASGFQHGGSRTTTGHNRQVAHISQSNSTMQTKQNKQNRTIKSTLPQKLNLGLNQTTTRRLKPLSAK
jgi:hypothetical protein